MPQHTGQSLGQLAGDQLATSLACALDSRIFRDPMRRRIADAVRTVAMREEPLDDQLIGLVAEAKDDDEPALLEELAACRQGASLAAGKVAIGQLEERRTLTEYRAAVARVFDDAQASVEILAAGVMSATTKATMNSGRSAIRSFADCLTDEELDKPRGPYLRLG